MTDEIERRKADLVRRISELLQMMESLMASDRVQSIHSIESEALADVTGMLQSAVAEGRMRIETALPLMELCLDRQEKLLKERLKLIEDARKQ